MNLNVQQLQQQLRHLFPIYRQQMLPNQKGNQAMVHMPLEDTHTALLL